MKRPTLSNKTHSPRELQFLRLWRVLAPAGLWDPATQHVFHPQRKWRFDFAWPSLKVAVEIHGGTRGRPVHCHQCGAKVRMPKKNGRPGKVAMFGGRHNNPSGFDGDCEKENAAVELGWSLLKFTSSQLDQQPAQCIEQLARVIATRISEN